MLIGLTLSFVISGGCSTNQNLPNLVIHVHVSLLLNSFFYLPINENGASRRLETFPAHHVMNVVVITLWGWSYLFALNY